MKVLTVLKELVHGWRLYADPITHESGSDAYKRCAEELSDMLKVIEALGKFVPGNGVGLSYGTIAWVVHDGKRYIREWHPMDPAPNGTPLGNWWDLEGGRDAMNKRFSEHEVTHYSIIEVPKMPDGEEPSVIPKITTGQQEFDITVGKHHGVHSQYRASTILVNPRTDALMAISHDAPTEEEAVENVAQRADAVLKTFFSEYKIVRL